MSRWRIFLLSYLLLSTIGGIIYWLSSGRADPRELVLGAWKDQTSRLFVEVEPSGITVRGLARGAIKYEWLQTEEEPYRMRCTYRNEAFEARLFFSGKNTAIVEPEIWERLPSEFQRRLAGENKRHNRPEHELRLLFHRLPAKTQAAE